MVSVPQDWYHFKEQISRTQLFEFVIIHLVNVLVLLFQVIISVAVLALDFRTEILKLVYQSVRSLV